jgi:DNA (cytosine-5)-methyltransferase 1
MISLTEQTNQSENRQLKHSERKATTQKSGSAAAAVIDLCCGLGGLSLAAKNLGFQVIAGVDLKPAALKTFSKNFPDAKAIEGSVRSSKILTECSNLLKPFKTDGKSTLIVSGPPCQGFSAAGSRDPADVRNQVLIAVANAIVELQPSCALVENVSMLLSDDNDDRVDDFENILFNGGYSVIHLLLDASEFGVPQKRERAFFLISPCKLSEEKIHAQLDRLKQKPIVVKTALRGLGSPAIRPDDYDDEHDYKGFHNHLAMQHSKRVMEKIAGIEPGKGPMSYRRLHPARPSNTLFSGHRAPPAHFKEPRSITVREAARLQGFPDSFRIYGSFGNQMEQVTNAVPPPLARAVLGVLAEVAGLTI